ncbi:MAG TPA: hypothetical protein VEV84_06660 [Pyrinomonadaceae bacterium]|nr:hypothetical protein [Pyrinomonadaceae bacterium]
MRHKYLFEKEGSDPEIERLEELLSVYRIDPVVPSFGRVLNHAKPATTFSKLRLLITYGSVGAFAAITLAVVMGTIWLNRQPENVVALNPAEIVPMEVIDTMTVPDQPDSLARDDKNPSRRVFEISKARHIQSAPSRKSQLAKVERKPNSPRLTPEEKYAYEQVRLALWLAGSKIKVVQDTINGVDEDKQNSSSDKR